ncbi:NAD(P)-binding protein [Suillus hirtellus]|nr:NAD(P)-binding protein [Suillus hirtellus]
MSKLILVAGATGKQGRALIKSLQPTSESDDIPFRVLALTRSASSSSAQRLAQERHVQVVEGDINSPESTRKVYEDAKGSGVRGVSHGRFFLDNYDDFIGSIAVGVLTRGLKEDTKVGMIEKDIGHVAAAVFKNPEKYKHQILVVIGRNLPSIPGFLAAIIVALNKSTQGLVQHIEKIHTARTTGQHEHFESQLNLCHEAYPQIKTVYDWAAEQQENQGQPETAAEWNKVSLWRLILGKL